MLIVGGQVIFIQTGGADIRGLDWNEQQRKYVAVSLIGKSGPIFRTALDLTYAPSTGREGETVFVVDANGDCAVAVIAADQPWPAWTTWSTGPDSHRILGATSPRGRTTFLVDRDGVVALEVLDPDRDRDVVLDAEGEVSSEQAFTRLLETMPFVARSATGTKRSVRKSRIFDCAVDFEGVGPDEVPPTATGYNGRQVRPGRPKRDTQDITRVRYGGRRGWRDRSTIVLEFAEHVQIAGIAYKAAG